MRFGSFACSPGSKTLSFIAKTELAQPPQYNETSACAVRKCKAPSSPSALQICEGFLSGCGELCCETCQSSLKCLRVGFIPSPLCHFATFIPAQCLMMLGAMMPWTCKSPATCLQVRKVSSTWLNFMLQTNNRFFIMVLAVFLLTQPLACLISPIRIYLSSYLCKTISPIFFCMSIVCNFP